MTENNNIIGRARARDMRVTVCGVCTRLPEDCVGHVQLRETHAKLGSRLRDMHPEDIPDVPEGYRAKARKAASTAARVEVKRSDLTYAERMEVGAPADALAEVGRRVTAEVRRSINA